MRKNRKVRMSDAATEAKERVRRGREGGRQKAGGEEEKRERVSNSERGKRGM